MDLIFVTPVQKLLPGAFGAASYGMTGCWDPVVPDTQRFARDVRGMALDEAIPEVEKFIDDAMLSSLGEVSIIHGNGTGVLRAGIQDCLRRHPCVSSFRLGRYGEGETGVTIVSLK